MRLDVCAPSFCPNPQVLSALRQKSKFKMTSPRKQPSIHKGPEENAITKKAMHIVPGDRTVIIKYFYIN